MPIEVEGVTTLIQVFDMPTSVRFYRDVLGFEVVMQSEPGDDFDWGLLRLHESKLMLNTAYEKETRPPAPDPVRIAAHEDTTFYFGADPDATYDYLQAKGVQVSAPKVAPYGMKQLYLKDPDGYVLCFQCPSGQ
jgi:catechol 2,3-dioxygenase-like lactoylglutathione lyase family enzyme